MKRWDVGLNNNSFDSAGIIKDCQEAVREFIWNGYEAHASRVEVSIEGEEMREAPVLLIKDDGVGIDHSTLKQTFGAFLSSEKRGMRLHIKSQANKGKGRYSYLSVIEQ